MSERLFSHHNHTDRLSNIFFHIPDELLLFLFLSLEEEDFFALSTSPFDMISGSVVYECLHEMRMKLTITVNISLNWNEFSSFDPMEQEFIVQPHNTMGLTAGAII